MSNRPFELDSVEKNTLILEQLNKLTLHHFENCVLYNKYLRAYGFNPGRADSLGGLPYLPARAFKEFDLKSTTEQSITSTVMSSGTAGLQSKIYLDSRTSLKQSRALSEILRSYIGTKKLPMLIFDSPDAGRKTSSFSARGAGTLGFSTFASKKHFALDSELNLNLPEVEFFLSEYGGSDFLIFGFTFLIWQSLVLNKIPNVISNSMSKGRLFHGGGWKKLESFGISDKLFKEELTIRTGLKNIHNYYGMAEQTGSIFVECQFGRMHASKYSDVIIRDENSLEVLSGNRKGIIQVFTSIAESYPGHSILTEDWLD